MDKSIKPEKKQLSLQHKSVEAFHVLLIEDNPGYAEVIQIMLEKIRETRFEVVCAKRLSDGLQILSEEHIDVVLLDLKLPDSQGIDTFEKVHEHAPDLPIIMLTVTDNDAFHYKAILFYL